MTRAPRNTKLDPPDENQVSHVENPALIWRWTFDDHPADLIGEAIRVLRTESPTVGNKEFAMHLIEEGIGRRLLASGLPHDGISAIKSYLDELVIQIMGDAAETLHERTIIDAIIDKFVVAAPRLYTRWLEEHTSGLGSLKASLAETIEEILDYYGKFDVQSPELRETLRNSLAKYLCDTGLSEADAAKIARLAVRDFQEAVGPAVSVLQHPRTQELAARLAASVHKITRERPADSFRRRAGIALPEQAPALWERKEDRLPGETPITFLQRVWKPWLEAAEVVLFQDDIARLGDKKLVRAIRGYCQRNGLRASEHLPPPLRNRTDRALAAAIPGSAEAEVLKSRIRSRQAHARKRTLQR